MVETIDTTRFGRPVATDFSGPWSSYVMVFSRVVVGWWLLAAGLEKLSTLWYGPSRPFSAAGWLVHGTTAAPGWLHAFLAWVGTTGWILGFTNVAIPLGEFLIGLGLLFGAFTRLASFFGAFLMFFFYLGGAAFANGYVTGDLLGILVFMQLIVFGAGRIWGVDAVLERTDFVTDHAWTRYLLG